MCDTMISVIVKDARECFTLAKHLLAPLLDLLVIVNSVPVHTVKQHLCMQHATNSENSQQDHGSWLLLSCIGTPACCIWLAGKTVRPNIPSVCLALSLFPV